MNTNRNVFHIIYQDVAIAKKRHENMNDIIIKNSKSMVPKNNRKTFFSTMYKDEESLKIYISYSMTTKLSKNFEEMIECMTKSIMEGMISNGGK